MKDKEKLYRELDAYLLAAWHPQKEASGYQRKYSIPLPGALHKPDHSYYDAVESIVPAGLDERLRQPQETFHEMLFRLMDETGETDAEIYHRAGIDRRYFAKIRSGSVPRKTTVMALCLALKLDVDRAKDLMKLGGYAFSDARRRDVIVLFCLEREIYDLMEVNELLDHYKEKLLTEA